MDPVQFMPQLLGRLEDNETTAEFKQRFREYSSKVWFEPDVNILERPGVQLLHSIHVHASEIDMMTITSCGNYVITVCGSLEEIKIWNIKVDPHGRVPLGHQDALFVTGSAGEDSPNIVGVYNVGRLEYRAIRELVRRRFLFRSLLIKVTCNANTRFYEADNRSVVMEIYDKFYLFDLEKMDVSIVFPGRVVECNVKLYNITNGRIDDTIKTGHKKEIYQVVVNDPGTLAAVTVVFGPVVSFYT
ncbi:hypothetical protein DPMN_033345 [Dreissena polymorpha]|uniref:Uncharacterized protein n=1 Tax=Dreissena polymorpha TaxID=45954 RepID=A0A9D4RJR4_DREPO|nr:hypothetical protein DPMN_033345 [Dreissena polymorpha]